jgi:hypothetical protein
MFLSEGTLFNGQRGGRSYGNSYYSPGGYRSSGKGKSTGTDLSQVGTVGAQMQTILLVELLYVKPK